jgi:hypothetical protein
MEIVLSRKVARKVLETVDAGLVSGLGQAVPGQMCVEAAVCYALGLPHGDNPACVGSAVRAFKIRLNDANWPTNESRTKGMRKLAIAQLGSNEIDQNEFRKLVVIGTVKRILPIALRAAASLIPAHKEALEGSAEACEAVVDFAAARVVASAALEVSRKARSAADAADAAADAADAAADAAAYAADAAAYAAYAAAADAAAYAAYAAAAADAAYAAYAAYAAAADAAASADASADAYADAAADASADAYAARSRSRIKVLSLAATIGLEALQKLKSPGCKWLDLCE